MMTRFHNTWLVTLALALTANYALAAPAVLGVATARGGFLIDHSRVEGNATLFDGVLIETKKASSSIRLSSGTTLGLAGDSRARVYGERLLLERGQGELVSGHGYRVEALGLRIEPSAPGVAARVAVEGEKVVQVAALGGEVRVLTGAGYLVGRVTPSRILQFEPQAAGAATPSKMRGCVTREDDKYYLTDVTSGVKTQVVGGGIEQEAGNDVEIQGTATGDQVQVNSLERVSSGCRVAPGGKAGKAAGAAGAAGGAAAGAAAGGATTAIIAGVAVAATAAGVASYKVTHDDDGGQSSSR